MTISIFRWDVAGRRRADLNCEKAQRVIDIMWRRILRWLLPLAFTFLWCLSTVQAQVAPQPGSKEIPRGFQPLPPTGDESSGRNPALPYTVAVVITLCILVIICTPSRKLPA